MTKYLTFEEILRLHFQVIEDFGGNHGIRDEGRLKSVVDAPNRKFWSGTIPLSLRKGAVYLRNIIGIIRLRM